MGVSSVGTLFGFVVTDNATSLTIPLLLAALILLGIVVWGQSRKSKVIQRAYVSVGETYLAYVQERDGHSMSRGAQQRQLEWVYATAIMLEAATDYVLSAHGNAKKANAEAGAVACDAVLGVIEDVRHRCLRYEADDPSYNIHLFRFDKTAGHLGGGPV